MPEPYSRIYWRFRDEYPDVYQDDAVLGAWVKLLMIAEGAHPSAADLPRKVRPSSIAKLIDEGLVVLYPGARYRIKGLSQERERRTEAARVGGLASGRSRTQRTDVEQPLNDRSTHGEPRRDETSKDEQSKDETRTLRAIPPMPVKGMTGIVTEVTIGANPDIGRLQKLAEELTGQAYVMTNVHSGFGHKAVTEQLPHGFDRVERAWRQIANRAKAEGSSLPTLRQIVFGADDLLNPVPSAKEVEREEDRELESRRRAKREQAARDNLAYLRGERRTDA